MLPKNASLRHVALAVNKLDECETFYNLLGIMNEATFVQGKII